MPLRPEVVDLSCRFLEEDEHETWHLDVADVDEICRFSYAKRLV